MRRHQATKVFLLFCAFATVFLVLHLVTSDDGSIQKRKNSFATASKRSSRHSQVMVAMVVNDVAAAEEEYSTALNSVRCYCRMHKYRFQLVSDHNYVHLCAQKDFMFRRHCIIAHLLNLTDWLVFLDADVAIVNPQVLIEDFIDASFDLTLYDRFVNWEVAAGSYIVRNTSWARSFLHQFADFESQLPASFHGSDNGALHVFLQRTFYPQLSDESRVCLKVWEEAVGFQDLFTFEACIRTVMGDVHEFQKARILKKGTGWVRDIWLTDSKWSPDRDFMLHGLKDANQISGSQGLLTNLLFGKFNWRSPFSERLPAEACSNPRSGDKWKYNEELIASSEDIEQLLNQQFAEVERRKWSSMSAIARYI